MAETDFLSFLVEETLKLQISGEAELSCLELKINDYKLQYLKGEFLPQIQILRFNTEFGVIDIPVNWSVFSLDSNSSSEVILSKDQDRDHLFEVLKTIWNPKFTKMLITHADGFCYVVGLQVNEEAHLHDLLNPQQWLKVA